MHVWERALRAVHPMFHDSSHTVVIAMSIVWDCIIQYMGVSPQNALLIGIPCCSPVAIHIQVQDQQAVGYLKVRGWR